MPSWNRWVSTTTNWPIIWLNVPSPHLPPAGQRVHPAAMAMAMEVHPAVVAVVVGADGDVDVGVGVGVGEAAEHPLDEHA